MPFLVITHVSTIEDAKTIMNATPRGVGGARVVGVYRYPDRNELVCPGIAGGCKGTTWRRAMPEGHMVHTCGRRRPGVRGRIKGALMDLLGINLMPRDRTPAAFRNPEGWDRPTKKRPPTTEG